MSCSVGTVQEDRKRRAAVRACEWIRDGMALGLGTGSTVRYVLEHIAERRAAGEWRRVVGVPTSEHTAVRAAALGIPLRTLADCPELDLVIDGADEIDPHLRLVKGLGGALLREKIVATAAAEVVIVADASKWVPRLGTRIPLPVEVDPFGAPVLAPFLASLGAQPELRRRRDEEPFVTDGGHWIFDCRFPAGISAPESLDVALQRCPGIIEHGLFLGLATAAVIAEDDGVRVEGIPLRESRERT